MDVRKFVQNLDHAVIVFKSMEAGPRETVFTGYQVLVEGLVLVPNETKMDAGHYLPNRLRTGGGGLVPLMASQRISFISSSSFRSASLKSSRADRAAVGEFWGLRSSSEIRGFAAWYGVKTPSFAKAPSIGRAAASK